MMDITNPKLLYLKAGLFLLGGCLASAGILLEFPSLRLAILLAIAIWCFARAYYFAFYVVQHYVDPGYRFAGLGSFLRYLAGRRCQRRSEPTTAHGPPPHDPPGPTKLA
jgi:hypothetical protein